MEVAVGSSEVQPVEAHSAAVSRCRLLVLFQQSPVFEHGKRQPGETRLEGMTRELEWPAKRGEEKAAPPSDRTEV